MKFPKTIILLSCLAVLIVEMRPDMGAVRIALVAGERPLDGPLGRAGLPRVQTTRRSSGL